MTELLDEWAGWVEANGATARHAALFRALVGLLAERLRWASVADLGAARVTRELGRLRAGDGGRRPISPGTSNHYVTACRAFGAWLRHAGYADADPFADLAKLDKPAKSVERRALTAGEFARLLAATRARTHSQAAVSGPDRAVLYLVAAYTGFRYSELLSLTPESFHLTGPEPFVRLAPAAAKNRTGVDQPLLAAVSDEVRPWLAGRSRGRPVWTRASHSRAAEIMRADLEAAGLPFETSEGRFDFHALRVQYITALALAGVDLATAQKLARHSTPVLTANVYTRLKPEALHNATAKLSPPPTTATGG